MPLLRSRSLRRRAAAQATLALSLALVVPVLPTSALAANGDLDPSFGSGGKTTTDFSGQTDEIIGMALQADGKIVAVGETFDEAHPSSSEFAVARYNTDGSLDPTFGDGGRVVTALSHFGDNATAVAVQSDGKIVVAGASSSNGINNDFAVARYLTDGSLDTDFGTDGKATAIVGTSAFGRAVAVLPDGKIVVGGSASKGGSSDFAVARLEPDGSLDTSFGSSGTATTDFSGATDGVFAMALQTDGSLVVAGGSYTAAGVARGALARYLPNGTLDTSFGTNGKTTSSFGGAFDEIADLALQADGKIVAAGRGGATDRDFAVARYTPDGKIDTSFGDAGLVLTDFGEDPAYAAAVAIRPDGRILAAGGATHVNGPTLDDGNSAVAQYFPDGTLDPNFGDRGKLLVNYSGMSSTAYAAVLQPDGYLVIGGYADGPSGDDFGLARIDARPETDYSISLDASTLTVSRKDRGDITVNVARVGGFDGNVVVTAPDTSALKVVLGPAQASTTGGSVSFSYKVKKKAARGSYPLEFKAVDDMGRARVVTLTLVIQ